MRKIITSILFAGLAASQLGSTDCGNAIADPGFDLWCGDSLCDWKVERGTIQRVPTWNDGDPGVELVGDDVAIEQLSPVASTDGTCIEFDLIANIDLDAMVTLDVDIFDDGSVDHSVLLPSAPWQSLAYKLPIIGVYRGIRFELAKQGTGHAVLAQIGAKVVADCSDVFIPITPAPAPLGAPCTADAGCASNSCGTTLLGQMCVGCTGTCPAGDTCGLGDPTSPVRDLPRECVADGVRELGEQCLGDDECASGICTYAFGAPTIAQPGATYGSCSTCRAGDHPCAGGVQCGPAWVAPTTAPFVCNPNGHALASGEPCASDDDCASSACSGTSRSQCDDGRECATSLDCPFGGSDTLDGLQNGPCTIVGVQGGSCQ